MLLFINILFILDIVSWGVICISLIDRVSQRLRSIARPKHVDFSAIVPTRLLEMNKKKNKKHSENADTSTSMTFDLEL